jgi:hypothetical protein
MGGHETGMGERRDIRVYKKFWWGNLRDRDHLKDPDIDGMIILRSIFRKLNVGHGPNRADSLGGGCL